MEIIKVNQYIIVYQYIICDNFYIREEEIFYKQVDEALNETYPRRSMLVVVSKTPDLLKRMGAIDLPIIMTQKHLYTIINKEGKYKYVNYHNLGVELIKKVACFY